MVRRKRNTRSGENLPSRRDMLELGWKLGIPITAALFTGNLPVQAQRRESEPSAEILPDSFPLFFPSDDNERLGYHLEGPAQDLWRAHSHGLILGTPITEPTPQPDGTLLQYFESGGLQINPTTQEASFLPIGRQFLEATGNTYADFIILEEETSSVEMVNRYFVALHGGPQAFGRPLTRPIPLQTNEKDRMQIFENLVLMEYETIPVPAEYHRTYTEFYHPKKQLEWNKGRSPLMWPGETLVLPIAQVLKNNGYIHGEASPQRPGAIAYQPGLWAARQEIYVNTNYYGQTLIAAEGGLVVMEIPISSGRDDENHHTTATPNEGTLIRDWIPIMDYRSPFPDDPYFVPDVPWNMTLSHNPDILIHGIYWHPMFGRQRSHGCINCTPLHAHWLYHWTAPQTVVYARQDIDSTFGQVRTDHLRRLTPPIPSFPLEQSYHPFA